jgi:hypothetical protein
MSLPSVTPNTASLVGKLVRLYSQPSNFSWLNPVPTGATEIDHFFEVQHVVALLFADPTLLTEGTWHRVPVAYFLDLSTSISGHMNLFRIAQPLNQSKKRIPWAAYAPGHGRHADIVTYLGYHLQDGGTVEDMVRNLAEGMARRKGPYAVLTRHVGRAICKHMGWPNGVLGMEERKALGDFDKLPWM